jgi:DNA polymerase III subunit delta'
MNHESLKTQQPIVERVLFNALKHQQASHAYLFVGPKGTQMKETAIFLAQSLVCQHAQPFACQSCDSCQRIEKEIFADLIILEGYKQSIKKEDVIKLQESFSKTALEGYGKKLYIIDGAERSSAEALNSLLKFLEEPSGNSTYAILISEQADRLLETIISRCQVLHFKPQAIKERIKMLDLSQYDKYEAQLLIQLVNDISDLENKDYSLALEQFANFLDEYSSAPYLGELYLQNQILKRKDMQSDRRQLTLFLNIGMMFFKDILFKIDIDSMVWKQRVHRLPRHVDPLKVFTLFNEGVQKINTNANLGLLVDALIYQLKEDEA